MASASTKIVKEGEDEEDFSIPDHLTCPVCFNLPEKEVFQCRDGHVLCSKCYFKLKECPQCRVQLDKNHPIRNRHFEGELEQFAKIECCFEGCQKKVRKCLMEQHQNKCYFNFQKFGSPVGLCKILQQDCNFVFNLNNLEDAMDHFVAAHQAKMMKKKEFLMELCQFGGEGLGIVKTGSETSENTVRQYFTPIIVKLEDKECYLLTIAVQNISLDLLQLVSYFLPFTSALNKERAKPDFKMEYSFGTSSAEEEEKDSVLKLVLQESPISFKVAFEGGFSHCSRTLHGEILKPYISSDNSLLIDCKIITGKANNEVKEKVKCSNMPATLKESETVETVKEAETVKVANRWSQKGGSYKVNRYLKLLSKVLFEKAGKRKACKMIEDIVHYANNSRGHLYDTFGQAELENIVYGAVFTVAHSGSVEAMKKLQLIRDLDWSTVNRIGCNVLHYTMLDGDLGRGLEKAKFLQDLTDCKALDDSRRSVLHSAAQGSNKNAVEYFIQLGLDVNGKDVKGRTPLHCTMMNYNGEEVIRANAKYLIVHGADPDAKDEVGRTPLDTLVTTMGNDSVGLSENIKQFIELCKNRK